MEKNLVDNDVAEMNEFQALYCSLKNFLQTKIKLLADIKTVKADLNAVEQESEKLNKQIKEAYSRIREFHSKRDRVYGHLMEIADSQAEIPLLRSRKEELDALLKSKQQENANKLGTFKMELSQLRNKEVSEFRSKIDAKKKTIEQELSSLSAQLATNSEDQILIEQSRKQDEELELLRSTITAELEQEKTTSHINCQSKARGLKKQVQELEERIDQLRNGIN